MVVVSTLMGVKPSGSRRESNGVGTVRSQAKPRLKKARNPLGARQNDEWETPPKLFNALDHEFSFSLDACASRSNHKVDRWYSIDGSGLGHDGLKHSWKGETVWVNPPFSDIGTWVKKAFDETRAHMSTTVVMLLPSNTDTKWFDDYCRFAEVRVLTRGRVAFLDKDHRAIKGNPRGSMVVIFQQGIEAKIVTQKLSDVMLHSEPILIQPVTGYGPNYQVR